MKKICHLEVDCVSCANKIEKALTSIAGVNNVNINFFFQKMTLDIDDNKSEDVLREIKCCINKIDASALFYYA